MKTVTKEMIDAYVAEVHRHIPTMDMDMCTELRSEQPNLFKILDNMAVECHDHNEDVTRTFIYYIHMFYKLLKRANDDGDL
jgi:hypothetical protein